MMPLFIVGHYVDQKMQSKRQAEGRPQAVPGRDGWPSARTSPSCRTLSAPSGSRKRRPSATPWTPSTNSGPLLWTHRPEHQHFLGAAVRAGHRTVAHPVRRTGRQRNRSRSTCGKSRTACSSSGSSKACPSCRSCAPPGSFGVAGARGVVDDVARGMVLQLVGLHSPAEVVLTAITSRTSRERWDWLQWLPARRLGPQPPVRRPPGRRPRPAAASLLARLEDLVEAREAAAKRAGTASRARSSGPEQARNPGTRAARRAGDR